MWYYHLPRKLLIPGFRIRPVWVRSTKQQTPTVSESSSILLPYPILQSNVEEIIIHAHFQESIFGQTCRILYVLLSRKLLEFFHYVAAHTGLDRWRWRSPLRLAIQSSTADSPFNVLQLWSVESKKALWKSGYFGAFSHFFFYPGLKSFYPDKIHACFTMPLILSQGEDSITTGVSAVTTSIWSRRPRSRTISHSDDIALCDTLECGTGNWNSHFKRTNYEPLNFLSEEICISI